ncbi:MAG: hypothetical protein U1E02_03135, partial [Hydrogenophaga sp.]|nr:hypothetical protein [Hydrogenophaga sp.]
MQRFLTAGLRQLASPAVLAAALFALSAGMVSAQAPTSGPAQDDPAPPAVTAPAAAQQGGIRSANIFEIAPDASTDPKYS